MPTDTAAALADDSLAADQSRLEFRPRQNLVQRARGKDAPQAILGKVGAMADAPPARAAHAVVALAVHGAQRTRP